MTDLPNCFVCFRCRQTQWMRRAHQFQTRAQLMNTPRSPFKWFTPSSKWRSWGLFPCVNKFLSKTLIFRFTIDRRKPDTCFSDLFKNEQPLEIIVLDSSSSALRLILRKWRPASNSLCHPSKEWWTVLWVDFVDRAHPPPFLPSRE